jgi:dTDP-4-dehydrorhamnose reductase
VTDLLVFGSGGQLGRELLARAAEDNIAAVGVTRAEADIADAAAVATAIARYRPRLVVNAAAYTAVDRAESEPDAAARTNRDGAGIVARACRQAGVALVHVSTDFVFDGAKAAPYVEDDPVAPLGAYGHTKAEGEARVRAETEAHVILRTAWVYGTHGHNFLKTILRAAGERDSLRVVADQRGCPTATPDLAAAILAVAQAVAEGRALWGTFHVAGTPATTWHDFASRIVSLQAAVTGRRPPVAAIATAEWPTPARRPANSELDCTKFATAYGFRAAPWPVRTRETVATLLGVPEAALRDEDSGDAREGDHSRRRLGHPAASNDERGVEATAAGLRQADDLLSAVDADDGGDLRNPGHHDAP